MGKEKIIVKAQVGSYPWGGNYRPRTEAELAYAEETGFRVRMRCEETEMRAVCTKPDEPVYQDSCMECFLNFYPEESAVYINFEVNANGAMLCQFGEDKHNRTYLRSMGYEQPAVTVKKTSEYWEVEYLIPLSLIQQVYGSCEFQEGGKIRGNFYKCGDLTVEPHYGCWNVIEFAKPNFHLPEFFGEIIIMGEGVKAE